MNNRFIWMALGFFLLIGGAVSGDVAAQQRLHVVILPFDIHTNPPLAYLATDIPQRLGRHFEADDITVSGPQSLNANDISAPRSLEGLRNLGIRMGADHILEGSLNQVGSKYSIDVKLLSSFGDDPAQAFYAEAAGESDLALAVKRIYRDITAKLLNQVRIAGIIIEGNERIEADAIRRVIKSKPDDIFHAKTIDADLKAIYHMGYFDDIQVRARDVSQGKELIFQVKEKPTIRGIQIKGNNAYSTDEIMENLDIKTGSILNVFKVQRNLDRIRTLYKEKNYHNVKVSYQLTSLAHNQSDLVFEIEEGDKVLITAIAFTGNEQFPDKKLKGLMKTKEKWLFSWLTSAGELNMENLNQDIAQIAAFYHNQGYIQARISDPEVSFAPDGIRVDIKIEEGPRYRVGKISLEGDMVMPKEHLVEMLKIIKEEYYNREVVRNDVMMLTDVCSDLGYAFADVVPLTDRHADSLTVDITYSIKKGQLVYFEKIVISGNTKTRDKVIRRELAVYEQERYSGSLLKRGARNLYRLDFFEDIKMDTQKGTTDNDMVLKLDVTEKPTGTFSFGGGYSNIEKAFVMAQVSQRNLFGRGQILSLKATLGSVTNKYTLSFVEPWLFDVPLSAGINFYNWQTEYDTYDKDSKGIGLKFSYPVFDYTRVSLGYGYDISEIYNIASDASSSIVDIEGTWVESSITTSLRYDSRDRRFNPTEGGAHSISLQYAGIGGDVSFTKYVAESGWYIPLLWETVGFIHGKAGYVHQNTWGELPDYEKFFLGGINSVRGFEWRDLAPEDEDGAHVGGDKFVQCNLEYIFPLLKDAGLMGVVFLDTGDVYAENEPIDFGDLRESTGFGVRWYSPMGPIRIEYGYILDYQDSDSGRGRWEFTMGDAF